MSSHPKTSLIHVRMLGTEPKIFHMLGKFSTSELHCIPWTLEQFLWMYGWIHKWHQCVKKFPSRKGQQENDNEVALNVQEEFLISLLRRFKHWRQIHMESYKQSAYISRLESIQRLEVCTEAATCLARIEISPNTIELILGFQDLME